MNNDDYEHLSQSSKSSVEVKYLIDLRSQYPEIKVDDIDVVLNVAKSLATYIVNSKQTHLFKQLTDTEKELIEYYKDPCCTGICWKITLCGWCCAAKYYNNKAEKLLSRYILKKRDLNYTRIDDTLKAHWNFLKFWETDNLMSILGCEKKYKISHVKVGLEDATTGFDGYILKLLGDNLVAIKTNVYNILKYELQVLEPLPAHMQDVIVEY